MSAFAVYLLNKDQTDLFYFNNDGNLDLNLVLEKMTDEFEAPFEGKNITGEGFLNSKIINKNIHLDELSPTNNLKYGASSNDYRAIHATITGAGSLGYYSEVYVQDGNVLSQKKKHTFYSKADIILTESGVIIAYFESVVAEKIKSQIKSLFEELGFDISTFKLSPEILKNIREKCDWTEVKLERIDNEEDSTKKVSYEIDITNKNHDSIIDNIYKDKGKMVQISFHLPYTFTNGKSEDKGAFCVKLYHKEHRGSLISSEFNDNNEQMKEFTTYISNFLLNL